MNKTLTIVSIFLLTQVFIGCSKGLESHDEEFGAPAEMKVNIGDSKSNSDPDYESKIDRVRFLVFGSTRSPDANKLLMNKYYSPAPANNVITEIITTGVRDVYIIVNEPLGTDKEELDDYKNISSVNDIRKLSLLYGGIGALETYIPDNIPMFVRHIDKMILVNSLNEVGGEVDRVMAKVTVNLKVKNSNFPVDRHVVIDNIIIKNLPEVSYMIPKSYAGALFGSEKQNAKVVAAAAEYNFGSSNTFYVPEYILGDPNKGAYIEISGHINGETNIGSRKWAVLLGDAMDDAKGYGNRYDITRNRHYILDADVKSIGTGDDLSIKITVLPWNTVTMDEETGRFIVYNEIRDEANNVIEALSEDGNTLTVKCNTNIGGWYVVARNPEGKVVHTSAPTAAVSTATDQAVTGVLIPRIQDASKSYLYTINIYQRAIAPEAIGPIRVVSLLQKGEGFIPNAVLQAAGWAVGRLPIEGGLQLAKRGNVLPSGSALTGDPKLQWKTSNTPTVGVESIALADFAKAQFGIGKDNTDAMTNTTALEAEHPAAKACRNLGSGWYLPSVKELKLILDNRALLGASYTFVGSEFWSSTESAGDKAWSLRNIATASSSEVTKNNNDRLVRCVKGAPESPTVTIAGAKWTKSNLTGTPGSSLISLAANPQDYGMFFKWGDKWVYDRISSSADGPWTSTGDTGAAISPISSNTGKMGYDYGQGLSGGRASGDPCAVLGAYRTPTRAQWKALMTAGSKWGTYQSVYGMFFGEKAASCTDTSIADGCIFLSTPGQRHFNNGDFDTDNSDPYGFYWSSSVGDDATCWVSFVCARGSFWDEDLLRGYGFSVRCVKE